MRKLSQVCPLELVPKAWGMGLFPVPSCAKKMKAISTEAIFTSFGSRVDGSLSFRGTTPELTTTEKVALMDLHNKQVKLLIQPMDETPDEVLTVHKILDFKTPSQRLRGVLFIEYQQQKPDCTFEQHYITRMEQIMERIKERLEPHEH